MGSLVHVATASGLIALGAVPAAVGIYLGAPALGFPDLKLLALAAWLVAAAVLTRRPQTERMIVARSNVAAGLLFLVGGAGTAWPLASMGEGAGVAALVLLLFAPLFVLIGLPLLASGIAMLRSGVR